MRRWLTRIRWGAAPVVIVSLVLGTLFVEWAKPTDPNAHPVKVAMNTWGSPDRAVEVQVNQVRTGSILVSSAGTPRSVSQGEYVVVNLTIRVDRAPHGSLSVGVETRDGTLHRGSSPTYDVGFAVTSDIPFEIPRDSLEGAVLTVRLRRALIALERVVVVDLGLTKERVDALPRYSTVKLIDPQKEAYR